MNLILKNLGMVQLLLKKMFNWGKEFCSSECDYWENSLVSAMTLVYKDVPQMLAFGSPLQFKKLDKKK